MKRWTWLLLALFCAALGQVRAVDGMEARAKPCPCCRPGACDMPGSCPAPVSANPVQETAKPASRAAQPAARPARLAHDRIDRSRFSCDALAVFGRHPGSVGERAPAAHAPLFRAHCSLLI